MTLKQYNNCNKIRVTGDIVDYLIDTTDFSNVNSITMTGSVNNCPVVEHQLAFTNSAITYPTYITANTECDSVDSCSTTLTYGSVYGDLRTLINTNVQLVHAINNTSSTTSFCGLTGTTTLGSNILSIQINTSFVSLQLTNTYNSGIIDYSANIKSDIETILTNNNIVFTSVNVTYLAGSKVPLQSRYTIDINSTTPMTGVIQTSAGNVSFTNIADCSTGVYGYNHKRSSFTVSGYDSSNTALVKWYTNKAWDYASATGVYIESYSDTSLNITYNTSSNITIFMEVTTNDAINQTIVYSWTLNGLNQYILNNTAILSTPHYSIVPNGDTGTIVGSVLTGATSNILSGTNCVNYLTIEPSFFEIDTTNSVSNSVFPDGIYALKILITFNDGTTSTLDCTDAVFMNCVLKCAVADCVYNTKSYELMTLYNALVALDDCDTYYVAEMTELFNLILSSLCKPIEILTNSLNEDCGCN